MNKNKRKNKWIWIIYISVGLVIGGVSAVTFISINKLINGGSKGITFKMSNGKNISFDFDGNEIPATDDSKKAIEFKIVKNNSTTNGIDDDVLKMVAKKFIERGIFGPELGALKSIVFNDDNLISTEKGEANGVYIPATKEIGISTKHINSLLSNVFQSKTARYKEILSEWIFQVLYHEYGHHIFASYAESPYTGSVKSIYQKNWNKKTNKLHTNESKWNELFLNKFMNIFSYDTKTRPIDSGRHDLQQAKIPTVGYKFSAYDLFNEININKNHPYINGIGDPNAINWDTEYLNLSSRMIRNLQMNGINIYQLKKSSIKNLYSYLYSAEELVTRKLLLASAPFSNNAAAASNYKGLYPYDLTSDFSNFATKPANVSWNNYANGSKIFMNDYLFTKSDNRAEEYMKLVDDTMGHKQNNNISFIWNMNNNFVAKTNNQIIVAPSKENEGQRSNPNKIKFGGYTDKEYNYVGYMDGNTFVPFKIKTYKYKIGYKESLLSGFDDNNSRDLRKKIKYYKRGTDGKIRFDENSQKIEDNSLSNLPYSYYLEQWVNANKIQGQVLYFANDKMGTNKKPMSGVISEKQGGTTSFSKWAQWELKDPYSSIWKAKNGKEARDNEKGLMIARGGVFRDAVS